MIPALRKRRQEHQEFKAILRLHNELKVSLVYTASAIMLDTVPTQKQRQTHEASPT